MSYCFGIKTSEQHLAEHHMSCGATIGPPSSVTNRPKTSGTGRSSLAQRCGLHSAGGEGARSWVQRADRQNKAIIELRPEFKDPEFPGFLNLIEPLSNREPGSKF